MDTKPDVKKQLEEILNQQISDEEIELIEIIQPVALSTNTNGKVTRKNVFTPKPNICNVVEILDVSGFATTDDKGHRQFHLTDFLCPGEIVL